MEGKLIKWTNYFSGWKERIFIIKGPLLYYYYALKELPRGKVHLGLATIINDENNDYFEINTGSNIFFLKAENKEMREKWVNALTKAKLEGEKNIREILKKNKTTKNPEYNDLIYPELNYDAELEQLYTAVTRLKIDNQNLMNYIESKNFKDPEFKILKERFQDDFEILQTCVKLFDPIDDKSGNNSKTLNLVNQNKILRNSSYDNLNINSINNNNNESNEIKLRNVPRGSFNQNPNREEDDYSMAKDNLINEPFICQGEEFYDMEEEPDDIENNFQNNNNNKYQNIIKIPQNNYYINNTPGFNTNNNNTRNHQNSNNYNYIKNTSINSPNNIINTNFSQITSLTKTININKRNKFYDPLYDYPKRTSLPVKKLDHGFNVWKVFKSAVGKDLSRFGVPVYFNEPISSLQKFCEPFQYAHLLNTAAKEPNPYIRLAKSACFCIGQFVMNNGRQAKFFNPLLYETYEYVDNEQNFRYMSEQVSHHPAISAYYAEGDGWNIFANTNSIIKFIITGRLEVNALGRTYITYENYNDVNSFTKPRVITRNLIIGTIDIDVEGKFEVTNEMGDICEVDMIPSTSGQKGNLHGKIKDINGDVKFLLEGNWTDNIYIINNETKEKTIIWRIIPSKGKEDFYYQPYTFDLNNLTEEMKKALPPTDSRFRPDQRLMEYQEIDKAGDEKHRLEEEQRARAKQYKKDGFIPKPLYFDETYDDLTGELIYKYKGNYWDMRNNHQFENLPKIF